MGDRFFNEKKEIENDKIMKILSVTGMYTKLLPETENSEGTFYLYPFWILLMSISEGYVPRSFYIL